MAMRRRGRNFGRRFGGRRNRPRWSADVANLDPAAGALAQSVILSEADFGTSTSLESECLVHRIVLSGDIICSTAGTALVAIGICKLNENVTPTFGAVGDPNLVDSLVDDDWLYTESYSTFFDLDGGLWAHHVYKDIRVKRKVNSNEVLRLVVSNVAGGVAVETGWLARILISPRL